MTKRIQLNKATRIVQVSSAGFMPLVDFKIADGTVVTATRVDAAGNASGTALTDLSGVVWATFAAPVVAGLWDFSV